MKSSGEALASMAAGLGYAIGHMARCFRMRTISSLSRMKNLLGELLVNLRDAKGLKYWEIIEIPIFSDLHYLSLAHLYRNHRHRAKAKYTK